MRSSKSETGFSLLGGALLGAAAMYLLDPDNGRRRRENLGDVTGDALGRTGDALGSAWEQAREAGSTLAEKASDLGHSGVVAGIGHRLGDLGHDLWDRARHLGHNVSDASGRAAGRAGEWAGSAGSDLADRARGMSHGARHRLANAIDPEHDRDESHVAGYTAAGVGTLLLGAGLMWLMDPERGRARRAWAIQKGTKILNDTGTTFRRTGRDLMNRARGTVHEARGQFGGAGEADGERLLQRVRSEIGHVLTYPTAVQLMADADGTVTLYGRAPASEVDRLLSTVRSVRGVSRIVNRLDVADTLDAVYGGAGGGTTGAGGTSTTGTTGTGTTGTTVPQM